MDRADLSEHRYRQLLRQLRDEDDRYGWKTRVGGLLGIAPQQVGMIERGIRNAGKESIGRAMQRLRLDPAFFYTGVPADELDYREFIGRRGQEQEPPPEAFGIYLERYAPALRPPLTDDESRWLQEIRYHRVSPESYVAALAIRRGGMGPEVAEESAAVTADAAKRGAALGVKRRSR